MERNEAIKLIDDRMCFGRGKWSKHHVPEIDDYWKAGEMAIKALEQAPAIPITYLTSRIAEFRAKDTYANQFAANFLQAIINEYNKEVHNGKTE